jgi:hypothetical protein
VGGHKRGWGCGARGGSPLPRLSTQNPGAHQRSGLAGRTAGQRSRYAGGWNLTLPTEFQKLNEGWDAEPNAPEPHVRVDDGDLTLTFFLNPWIHPNIRQYDRGEIVFRDCWRYRVGAPNDEGWYKGYCRFRCLAPEWGDFYEVTGDLLETGPKDWVLLNPSHSGPSRHFIFYFRDETFECDADDWSFRTVPTSDGDYERLRAAEVRVTLQPLTFAGFLRDIVLEPFRRVRRWLGRMGAVR